MDDNLLPRFISDTLSGRLSVMPAVVVTGARQTGKSTLVQELLPGDRRFLTLDDLDVLDLARRDPEALLTGPLPVTLDEIQREPALLLAVKRAIDRDRSAGRFLITGSANLLLMRRVSETLAGRASYITLWPMTRREQLGLGRCGRWEELVATPEREWLDLIADGSPRQEDWRDLARRGGYPTPALHLSSCGSASRLVRWVRDDVPGTRSPGPLRRGRAARFSPSHAGRVSSSGTGRQPDRARPGRRTSSADGSPLSESPRDIARADSLPAIQSTAQTAHQITKDLLKQHRARHESCGPAGTHRRPSGEHHSSRSGSLA